MARLILRFIFTMCSLLSSHGADVEKYRGERLDLPAIRGGDRPILRMRTLPEHFSSHDYCDIIAISCLKVHQTGKLCAKTIGRTYNTFHDYCALDYANCMEGTETWEIAYMGECIELQETLKEYMHYGYLDDFHLDQYYVVNDW